MKLGPSIALLAFILPAIAFAGDLLELRLAQSTQKDGWQKAELDGKALWLRPEVELTSKHVASASFRWQEPPSAEERAALDREFVSTFGTTGMRQYFPTNRELEISIKLTDDGREMFAKLTTKHIGDCLAVLVNGKVVMAPVIRSPIPDGNATITGGFTEAEAKELVQALNAGGSSAGRRQQMYDYLQGISIVLERIVPWLMLAVAVLAFWRRQTILGFAILSIDVPSLFYALHPHDFGLIAYTIVIDSLAWLIGAGLFIAYLVRLSSQKSGDVLAGVTCPR